MKKNDPAYNATQKRIYSHLDWYLFETLSFEGDEKTWTLDEIQNKLHSATGIRLRISTIFRVNSELFQEYQTSPLRRVDYDNYSLDPSYYLIAGDKIRPPPLKRGRPKKLV